MDPLSPAAAATLLAREFKAAVEPVDVMRMVRHGHLPGEAQAGGRVVVDGAGLRELVDITRERQYGRCEPMTDLAGLVQVRL